MGRKRKGIPLCAQWLGVGRRALLTGRAAGWKAKRAMLAVSAGTSFKLSQPATALILFSAVSRVSMAPTLRGTGPQVPPSYFCQKLNTWFRPLPLVPACGWRVTDTNLGLASSRAALDILCGHKQATALPSVAALLRNPGSDLIVHNRNFHCKQSRFDSQVKAATMNGTVAHVKASAMSPLTQLCFSRAVP